MQDDEIEVTVEYVKVKTWDDLTPEQQTEALEMIVENGIEIEDVLMDFSIE